MYCLRWVELERGRKWVRFFVFGKGRVIFRVLEEMRVE